MSETVIFKPIRLKNTLFKNRIIRSSLGGPWAQYDGKITPTWSAFEERFARGGVAAIISATVSVDAERCAPLAYPQLTAERFVPAWQKCIETVQAYNCRYILQLGDPGAHTQTALWPNEHHRASASATFDLFYGYQTTSQAMTTAQIEQTVDNFTQSAHWAQQTGCDGIEITASKGYLLHQFLNPATNRRQDKYGGDMWRRFQFLKEVIEGVRSRVGGEMLLGVRLSAVDFNYLPVWNVRWPPRWPWQLYWQGNGLTETTAYGRALANLGVDYLHITAGFGFPNPHETPGHFPAAEVRAFANSTRHLSHKSRWRVFLLHMFPLWLTHYLLQWGWGVRDNGRWAEAMQSAVGIPVIANGGFQQQERVAEVLSSGISLVSMARPLLANPDLLRWWQRGVEGAERPCTWCNRCTLRTTNYPLACYDPTRFDSLDAMHEQILSWSASVDDID
ncbi:MAG TPA: NADH:flavin oxidoreductase [Anaerolineae bacterium]|nr:NADH:flavin oxidoreductase [Anaerolineae bacterium]